MQRHKLNASDSLLTVDDQVTCCAYCIPKHTVVITGYTVAPGHSDKFVVLSLRQTSGRCQTAKHSMCMCLSYRQCSSGLQAVADVAAAIRAGFYQVGLAGGVEAMSQTPMAWEGGVNPRAAKNKKAMSCLIPMGEQSMWALCHSSLHLPDDSNTSTVALRPCNLWQLQITHLSFDCVCNRSIGSSTAMFLLLEHLQLWFALC